MPAEFLQIDAAILGLGSRAVTATTSTGRPQRATSDCCSVSINRITAAPTVPKPARPTLSGATISKIRKRRAPSAARDERNDVVQRLRAAFEEAADVARGLADALLVLDQRDADMIVAVLAEADAGRDCDLRLLDQEL